MPVKAKHKINVRLLLEDLRDGHTDGDLMEKYRLSARGLSKVFDKLIAGGFLSRADLEGRIATYEDTAEVDEGALTLPSEDELVCLVPVRTADGSAETGMVCNLGAGQIEVSGIGGEIGDTRRLTVLSSMFFPVDSFTVEAQCIWRIDNAYEGQPVSGWIILAVDEDGQERLRKLVSLVRPME